MFRAMNVFTRLALCVGCLALSAVGCLDPMDASQPAVVIEQGDDPTSAPGELTTASAEGQGRLSTGGVSPSPVDDTPSEPATPDRPDEPVVPVPDPVDILDPAQFIAHEWGTFVSMVTPGGQILEGMHHAEEPLPPFVHSRCSDVPWCADWQSKLMDILPEPVTQKLETPVIYFYSAEPREVTVDVSFPQGIISEWFPDATAMQPIVGGPAFEIANGAMTWTVDVDPAIDLDTAPWVPEDHIWAPSRDVAATPIAFGDETESFIFYRGLGRFQTPLNVTNDGTTISLGFKCGPAIPSAWLLHVRDGVAAISSVGSVTGGTPTKALIPVPDMDMATFLPHAKAMVAQGLEADGLFADEAWAMVNTWERSYFKTEGLRVLYVLPRQWTDELLPISVDPIPDELVRTLVGRVEALTPGDVDDMVQRVEGWHDAPETAAELTEMPRFAEPRLRAACKEMESSDSPLVSWCESLIATVYDLNL
ncbi:MAG: hypothetical protein QF464_06730 [Myxococcota bacterium]|jgi:hypothetical protein|nr:hypothetical protein [Myxococcota bacterium]